MDELVNIIRGINQDIFDSRIELRLKDDRLIIKHPDSGASVFNLELLYRASSEAVRRAASPDTVLVLSHPTQKAAAVAARYNHILVQGGGYRIMAPGVAVFRESRQVGAAESRSVRLKRRTGVIAEALLLRPNRTWTVQTLAREADVSPALAHRVLARLDEEGLTSSFGTASQKVRRLTNPRALAELWSQEESDPLRVTRAFLYGGDLTAVARKIAEALPAAAVGGAFAANEYMPVLTRVNPPLRIWVPNDFVAGEALLSIGGEIVAEGANVELLATPLDPWRVKLEPESSRGFPLVSPWRAWLEISRSTGRTKELAEELMDRLLAGVEIGNA